MACNSSVVSHFEFRGLSGRVSSHRGFRSDAPAVSPAARSDTAILSGLPFDMVAVLAPSVVDSSECLLRAIVGPGAESKQRQST
jgi:hypothetical protein